MAPRTPGSAIVHQAGAVRGTSQRAVGGQRRRYPRHRMPAPGTGCTAALHLPLDWL